MNEGISISEAIVCIWNMYAFCLSYTNWGTVLTKSWVQLIFPYTPLLFLIIYLFEVVSRRCLICESVSWMQSTLTPNSSKYWGNILSAHVVLTWQIAVHWRKKRIKRFHNVNVWVCGVTKQPTVFSFRIMLVLAVALVCFSLVQHTHACCGDKVVKIRDRDVKLIKVLCKPEASYNEEFCSR